MLKEIERLSKKIKCNEIKEAYICWKGKKVAHRWTLKVCFGEMLYNPDETTCIYGTVIEKGGIGCFTCQEEAEKRKVDENTDKRQLENYFEW